jgi:hypothetical protein
VNLGDLWDSNATYHPKVIVGQGIRLGRCKRENITVDNTSLIAATSFAGGITYTSWKTLSDSNEYCPIESVRSPFILLFSLFFVIVVRVWSYEALGG